MFGVAVGPHDLVLLDACAVISLYASRRMPDIVGALSAQVVVAELVHRESLYVLRGGSGDDADEREPVDLSPMIAAGSVLILPTSSDDELETFIDLTTELDDGEAMTLALAVHRGFSIVTDDRKAARVAAEHEVAVLSTLDLVRAWVEDSGISIEAARAALIDIRQRGSYVPGRAHPLKPWWDRLLGAT